MSIAPGVFLFSAFPMACRSIQVRIVVTGRSRPVRHFPAWDFGMERVIFFMNFDQVREVFD
ncbi:hypothetical protein ACLRDC_20510, partial [Gluconacetobacter sacchari]|uniref:hypothetical protein n=1 Tax=Gluconacetobacter sacchari TaxID=92759 RepID=UPI0039B44B71